MIRRLLVERYVLIGIILVLSVLNCDAQPGGGGNPGGGGAPPTPITGIEFLLGAGCLVGIKRSIGFLKGLRKSS